MSFALTRAAQSPRLRLLVALLLLLTVACTACLASAREATEATTSHDDPYAYLNAFDLAGLKKYAFDTYPNKIDLERYSDAATLRRAVVRLEKQADRAAQLRSRLQRLVQDDASPSSAAAAAAARRPHRVVIEACEPSHYLSKVKKMLADGEVYLGQDQGLQIDVRPIAYTPSTLRTTVSQAFKATFWATIAMAILGGQFLPAPVRTFVEQRKGIVMSTSMILNVLSNSVLQTGAFEVFVDGQLVHSRLETGVMPESWELSELILEKAVFVPASASLEEGKEEGTRPSLKTRKSRRRQTRGLDRPAGGEGSDGADAAETTQGSPQKENMEA